MSITRKHDPLWGGEKVQTSVLIFKEFNSTGINMFKELKGEWFGGEMLITVLEQQ